MSEFFRLFTPFTYWVLIALWLFILAFYVKRIRIGKSGYLFFTLILILAIDAFRTLFESIYFGIWYTSLAGLIPRAIADFLMRPEMVIIPKLINVVAAIIVIVLLLKRWLPHEEKEKSRSARALFSSEQKFKTLTNQSVDGITVSDLEGNYSYVNPTFCKMIGYSETELLGMTVFDVTHDKQDKRTFDKSKGSSEGIPIHVQLERKDGSTFLAEVVGKLIDFDEGRNVLGVIRDITDREKVEQRAQHRQKMESLGLLAGGIAHDFNNLLTAILGNASLAMSDLSPSAPARNSIMEIEKASKRAGKLAGQMLAYSGRGQFVVQSIDTRELVDEISHLLGVTVSKKITITYNFAEKQQSFLGDVTQISQVVMNLITNASEAIGDQKGFISLSTGEMDCSRQYLDNVNVTLQASLKEPLPEGHYTYVEVSDTGCGMDEETIGKIFDPFFSTKFTGRGLGMSAVLGIVRGHQGAINVYSEVGKGTSFKVLFPVEKSSETRGQTEYQDSDEGTVWQGHGTILLVDDEKSICRMAKAMLERLGFNVLVAYDGEEALAVYREHANGIVCVLLDLTMPNMDGRDAFREIRILNPNAKVILCSGYNEYEATQQFYGKGLAGFIHKPYELDRMKEVLSKIL